MGRLTRAFCATALCTAIGTVSAAPRVNADIQESPVFGAIKTLSLNENENCTLQFGSSKQVATTAAHCFDFIILGIDNQASVKDTDGSEYKVTQIYIPQEYQPRDTSNKMYFDKAIVVLDRPVMNLAGQFRMKSVEADSLQNTQISVTQAGYPYFQPHTLSANMQCQLSAPQFHKNGKNFVLKHNCTISPGNSGSAAWDQGSDTQRAIVTSLNYAVPLTDDFIKAYENVARMQTPSGAPYGFIKVKAYAPTPQPNPPHNPEVIRIKM